MKYVTIHGIWIIYLMYLVFTFIHGSIKEIDLTVSKECATCNIISLNWISVCVMRETASNARAWLKWLHDVARNENVARNVHKHELQMLPVIQNLSNYACWGFFPGWWSITQQYQIEVHLLFVNFEKKVPPKDIYFQPPFSKF